MLEVAVELQTRNWKEGSVTLSETVANQAYRSLLQWKPLNRTSFYRANRLFEQFRLKKKRSHLFPLVNSSLIRAGTPLMREVRRVAAPWLARSSRKNEVKQ